MLANDDATLRGFCARILGWTNDAAIDHAIHSLDLAADHHAALVLLGETDLAYQTRGSVEYSRHTCYTT